MHFIFDLDHTVIDSSHRQITRADGSLDLAAWRRNNTKANIMADTLLPLAKEWQRLAKKNVTIVICTARVMGEHDYEYLRRHGLRWDACLSRRPFEITPDAELKEKMIRDYARTRPMTWARFCATSVFYDDNKNVLAMLDRIGIRAYDSLTLNARLSA
jgi:FMN phosphatase YigB (HAD superfamily)|tara:strand:+ start:771 stop:1244 length:474 start_codon:yes stop_codon:yes gene_type:complete